MTAYLTDEAARRAIVAVGRRMYAKGFVASNDGNISCQVGERAYWTTPTGVCKGDLTEEMLVKVDSQGHILAGHLRPSSELKMHLRVYQENSQVRAVVHAHPPMATAFAVAGIALDQPILPEAILQLGTVPVAPYATPGTQAVPDSVAPYCQAYQALLLANHGALIWGADLWQAYFRLETLEHYAKVVLLTGSVLGQARPLTAAEIAALLNY